MINRLFNELIINSYQERLDIRETLAFITNFEQNLERYFQRKKTVYKIQAPTIFNEGNEQNENNYFLNEPRAIFFGVSDFLAELSIGCRKWARIIATNIKLKQNEVLIVRNNSFNLNHNIDSSNASISNEIVITIPILLSLYNEKQFAIEVRKFYTAFIKIIEKTFLECGLKPSNLGDKITIFDLNQIDYNDEKTLENEILGKINKYSECVGIYNIPTNHRKNYFFKYDVYDHKFFVRFYGCNKFATSAIDLWEISLTVHNNIYQQCKASELSDYKESNYYTSIQERKLGNYLQIKFNLAKIYLFFLQKYTINEIISAPITNTDYLRYRKKKINIL